jgi:hypothetical protein
LFDLLNAKLSVTKLIEPLVVLLSNCNTPHSGIIINEREDKVPFVLSFSRFSIKNKNLVIDKYDEIDQKWTLSPLKSYIKQSKNGIVRIPCIKDVSCKYILNGIISFGKRDFDFSINGYLYRILCGVKREKFVVFWV